MLNLGIWGGKNVHLKHCFWEFIFQYILLLGILKEINTLTEKTNIKELSLWEYFLQWILIVRISSAISSQCEKYLFSKYSLLKSALRISIPIKCHHGLSFLNRYSAWEIFFQQILCIENFFSNESSSLRMGKILIGGPELSFLMTLTIWV